MKRVLYIQYTNPGSYPPLEHSSKMLADAGWDVLFLGTGSSGADALDFPPHPRIRLRKMPFQTPGLRQKLHYVRFCIWVIAVALWWRPRWVYASDPFSCPPALFLSFVPWLGVIYHEHDSPPEPSGSGRSDRVFGLILSARHRLAHRARLCILPNMNRLRSFEERLGPVRESVCVWNCPRRDEVAASAQPEDTDSCIAVYHGSIVPERVPRSLVHALTLLPEQVRLRVTGYETVGARGYPAELTALATSLGVAHRLEFRGPVPRRHLMKANTDVHIGLALTPMRSADANFLGMTGASNKAFDYMACGLALVVSDLQDWKETFVAAGFGLACNPEDARSVANAIGWLAAHSAERRKMGESGRQMILSDWNYETVFAPVLRLMSGARP